MYERIVCLTEETTETLYTIGEDWRIVGISGFTVRPPRARREKPKVSAFTTAKIDEVLDAGGLEHQVWLKFALKWYLALMALGASVTFVAIAIGRSPSDRLPDHPQAKARPPHGHHSNRRAHSTEPVWQGDR